jgi:DNA repair photolyase
MLQYDILYQYTNKEPLMSLIYTPKGKAREYSPLSFNIFNGCDHGCTYCYVPQAIFRPGANMKPLCRKNILPLLEKELNAKRITEQVLLCFLCDPYPLHDIETATTRSVLELFLKHNIKTAILTKGGTRILRDLPLLKKFPGDRLKVGATLTFFDDELRQTYEPNAAPVMDRLSALEMLHDEGIKTFCSIEPVMSPTESNKIDWTAFLKSALDITRSYEKKIYVKFDLRESAPSIKLSPFEKNQDALNL